MSLSINTIISALDTPSSLLPFFVKDAFDVTGRTAMAYNEGGKHEAREKFIEEAGTSLFWIGGIPAIRAISNKIFKNKLNTEIHFKRINTQGAQSYFAKNMEGIELGGEKLKQVQKKLAGNNLEKYKKYHVGTTAASVLINLFMLAVALPMFNQFLSRKIIFKEAKNKTNNPIFESNQTSSHPKINKKSALAPSPLRGQGWGEGANNDITLLNTNYPQTTNTKPKTSNPSFCSLSSLKDFFNLKELFRFSKMAESAQLNVQSSMLLLDYGISGSRTTFIPRDNNERIEYIVKESGIIFFFYFAADLIKNGLAKIADKVFKTPIDLDYKILSSPEFLKELKNNKDFLQFPEIKPDDTDAELKVIKLIDKELSTTSSTTPKEKVFGNFTLQMAQKEGLIDVEYDETLKKWIRHSKKYIETEKVTSINNNLKNFCEKTFKQTRDETLKASFEKIIAKTKGVKIASVFINMAICCASVSFILPKIQYKIREYRTKTKAAPGIKIYQELAENNQLKV